MIDLEAVRTKVNALLDEANVADGAILNGEFEDHQMGFCYIASGSDQKTAKIGRTRNLARRAKTFKTHGQTIDFAFVGHRSDTGKMEKECLWILKDFRIKGSEWFKFESDELVRLAGAIFETDWSGDADLQSVLTIYLDQKKAFRGANRTRTTSYYLQKSLFRLAEDAFNEAFQWPKDFIGRDD